jgi:hypothetical protein
MVSPTACSEIVIAPPASTRVPRFLGSWRDFRRLGSRRIRLGILIPEVTIGRTFHDGLGARQLDAGIEALGQGKIALARQAGSQLGEP